MPLAFVSLRISFLQHPHFLDFISMAPYMVEVKLFIFRTLGKDDKGKPLSSKICH